MDNRTLYIHDNLDILRGMNSESVDLIATDPPFNKGRDFHATPDSLAAGARFQDRWSWEADVHEDWVSLIRDDYPQLYEFIDFVVAGLGNDSKTRRKNGGREDLAAFLCWLGVRVIEMRRILKPTGSLYLHCDPTASHYIKAMLDTIFGVRNFRNEIVWCYRGMSAKATKFQQKHDLIFFYAKDVKQVVFNTLKGQPTEGSLKTYQTGMRVGYNANHSRGMVTIFDEEKYRKAVAEGKIPSGMRESYFKGGSPPLTDWWSDIKILGGPKNKERLGYPTQKPVDLYKRIIAASSNEGDLVLDPFCGCATTLIAAETLNRHWIGIDLWEHAATTLQQRIGFPVHARREPPVRTDDEADAGVSLPSINRRQRRAEPWMRLSHADMRDILYAAQDGVCAGCGRKLHIRFMQLDHMQPRAEGGANTIDNRVMLCSPCNGAKGAVLTILGLARVNKRDEWLEDEGRRRIAYDRARLVGGMFKEKEREALIRLVGELPIDGERKAALERLLAPAPIELAVGG